MDTDTFQLNGNTPIGQDVFQTPLFSSGNLSSGPHEITITNQGSHGGLTYFDIDFIIWEGSLPDNSISKTFTNRDTQFEYLPGLNWWSWGQDNNSYDGTLYFTQSSSAAFRFNFTGESIALYGYLDTNHGNFSCSIDGISRGDYSGYYPSKAYQQLVCFSDGLDDGDHILHVTNLPLSANNGWFSIDYAEVWGTNPCVCLFSTNLAVLMYVPPAGEQLTRGAGKHLRKLMTVGIQSNVCYSASSTHLGAIVGGVVGGVLFLAVLAGLAAFFLRRRRNAKRAGTGQRGSRPIEHHDVFEIDGHPVSGDNDPNLHPHITPYDPYGDSASTVAEQSTYVTEVLGSSRATTIPSGGNRSPGSSISPNDSQSQVGSVRYRAHSNTSNSRYLAPRPEQDAGPLIPLNESDDEDELRAVSGPSLPPVYSSIISAQSQQTALRDEKLAVRPGMHVVGQHADEDP